MNVLCYDECAMLRHALWWCENFVNFDMMLTIKKTLKQWHTYVCIKYNFTYF